MKISMNLFPYYESVIILLTLQTLNEVVQRDLAHFGLAPYLEFMSALENLSCFHKRRPHLYTHIGVSIKCVLQLNTSPNRTMKNIKSI